MSNKEHIENLLKETERPGIENLLKWMEQNGFYDAPCSSKYHLAKPGGLAEHSLNVFRIALSILPDLFKQDEEKISYEFVNSVVICSLLHDLGKAGQFGKPNYIMTKGQTGSIMCETNKDLLYVPHEIRSIAIASRYIDLTEEEQFAILYHNGLYSELKGFKGSETPLYLLLSYADLWAARITEREDEK
jgi:23S rRNA maturation-related 3'-5' exoribonuclease YhaM